MKKLISLLAALAVVTTGTAAFATDFTVETKNAEGETVTSTMAATDAATQATYEADEDGLYTVDLASVAGTQDQTTILAVEGKTIKVGSIKYINQSATQSFTFGMDEPADTVYVLAGGSAINPTLVGSIAKEEVSTGATVSGTVGNVVTQEFIDGSLSAKLAELQEWGMFEGTDYTADSLKADFIEATATTAKLYDKATWTASAAEAYVRYFLKGAEAPVAAYSADVAATSGEYKFEGVADGDYVLVLERENTLPKLVYVTVAGENVTVDSVNMNLGNVVKDDFVDMTDALTLISDEYVGMLGFDTIYSASNDVNLDYEVGMTDALLAISDLNASIWDWAVGNPGEDPYVDIMDTWFAVQFE